MGSAIASFKLRELFPIGRGGMGTTYLACASTGTFERLVVVKRLNEHLMDEVDARQRLIEEAQLAGCVHHANVVGIQHAGFDDRGAFLVLDFVEGASLRQLMRALRPEKVPENIALRVVLDCLAGLQAIHTAKDTRGVPLDILHRDVTPENILIGLDGVARLGDFGIAKSVKSAVHTAPLQLVGKLPFLAPEYIDHGAVGPPLDVYAVGISLWRLLVGRAPWQALEEAQLLVRILTEGVPKIPRDSGVAPDLAAVVDRACARRAEDRYPTALALAEALESLRPHHPIADHAEVAALLASTVGPEASVLRDRAAEVLGVPSLAPPAELELDEPGVPTGSLAAPRLPSFADPGESLDDPALLSSRYLSTTVPRRGGRARPRTRLRTVVFVTLGAVAAAALAFAALDSESAQGGEKASFRTKSPVNSTASPSTATPDPTSTGESSSSTPIAVAPHDEFQERDTSPQDRPTGSVGASRNPPISTTKPATFTRSPSPATPTPAEVTSTTTTPGEPQTRPSASLNGSPSTTAASEDGIVVRNPYRH